MDEHLITRNEKYLTYDDMPLWTNSNSFIITGYRPTNEPILYYVKSLFRLHNETINIWTHLLGALLFIYLLVYINIDPNLRMFTSQTILMNVYTITCILTYGLSSIMHTFYPLNNYCCTSLQTLDYLGIGLQIFSTLQVFLYYSFYCQKELMLIYMNLVGAFNIISLIILTNKKFTSNEYRKLKVGCFLSQIAIFIVPLVHRILLYNDDIYDKVFREELGYFILAFISFIFCIVFYLGLIPERFIKKRFDIFGSSHQIFHILCVIGSVFMYLALKKIMDQDTLLSCSS